MTEIPNRKRRWNRWFRIRLRSLLVGMLFAGVVFGYVGSVLRTYRAEQNAIAALNAQRIVIDRVVDTRDEGWADAALNANQHIVMNRPFQSGSNRNWIPFLL